MAYWRLGEASSSSPAADVTANANAGTYQGTITTQTAGALTSDPDSAVSLDGSTAYVSVPDSATLDAPTSAITLEAIVKPTSGSFGSQKPIILKSYTSHVAPYYQYGLFMSDSSGTKSLSFWLSIGGTSQTLSVSSTGWTYGAWNDIAATYDGSTMRLYVNGTQVGSRAQTGQISSYSTALDLGAYANLSKSSSYLFGGGIDEVAVYDHALSATDLEGHFNSESTGCADIAGATSTSYTVAGTDANQAIVVAETATNSSGSSTQVSLPILITSGVPVNQVPPVISGSYASGDTLTVDNGTWANTPTSYSYQWSRCTYAPTINNDSPAAYWRFDDNDTNAPTDATANGNNGTYSGSYSITSSGALGGDPSQYLSLVGSTGYASIPDAASLDPTSAITLEAWVKPTSGSVAAQKPILVKSYTSYATPYYQYGLLMNDSTGQKMLSFVLAIGGGSVRLDVSNSGWTYGAWNYVAATYDGTTMRLYLNGTQIGSQAHTGSISTYATPLDLGAYDTLGKNSTYLLGGGLDEVAVYGSALTATSIANHYAAATPSCSSISGATTPSYTLTSTDATAQVFATETASNSSGSSSVQSGVVSSTQLNYPYTTRSYYERNASTTTLYQQGCSAGDAGAHGLVILDFGRPAYVSPNYGTLDLSGNFHSFAAIETAVEAYISGFWDCTPVNGPFMVVAIGTNNSCPDSGPPTECVASSDIPPSYTTFGTKLADAVSDVQAYISKPPSFTSQLGDQAADDAEPGWDSYYTDTGDAIAGWTSEANSLGMNKFLYDFGSMEGGFWSQAHEYYVAYGASWDVPVPEIYLSGQVTDWMDLNSYSETTYGHSIIFQGVMSQWRSGYSCGYTPHQGYAALVNQAKNDLQGQTSIKYLTNIVCST